MDNNARPAHLSPSGFANIMTAYGLTDAQQKEYDKLMKRKKPLTDNMKSKVAKFEEKLSDPFSQTAKSYAEEIVQRLIGVEIPDFTSQAMQDGIDREPFAVELYELTKMVEVTGREPRIRKVHPEYDYISGETDGLVGDVGCIEIKSPNEANHFKNLLNGEQINQYKYQIQGYMWLYDREWCDFVSFNPNYPEKYQLSVNRVVRDQDMIDELEERCVTFWEQLVEPLKEKVDQI